MGLPRHGTAERGGDRHEAEDRSPGHVVGPRRWLALLLPPPAQVGVVARRHGVDRDVEARVADAHSKQAREVLGRVVRERDQWERTPVAKAPGDVYFPGSNESQSRPANSEVSSMPVGQPSSARPSARERDQQVRLDVRDPRRVPGLRGAVCPLGQRKRQGSHHHQDPNRPSCSASYLVGPCLHGHRETTRPPCIEMVRTDFSDLGCRPHDQSGPGHLRTASCIASTILPVAAISPSVGSRVASMLTDPSARSALCDTYSSANADSSATRL